MNIPVILKELAKISAITLTEETVKTFVETKIKPIFVNWGKDDLRSVELEDCLSEYLLRCYAKNNIMTTIVFGKLQKTIDDLYIPLTLEEYRNEDKKWIIDENCYDILDIYSRILIVDMAGMGKSTIIKYFACQGINLDKSIPIIIELRRLGKNQAILEYIQRQINSLDKNIKIEEIVNILKKGDFVIFFDGYDEIANENKSDVLDAIQDFTSKATNTKIVITSREDDDLISLGEYKCVNIKPLTEGKAYELIRKYDNDGEISKKLVKKLKEDSTMYVLKEFLENPLLVSLLYKTFEYKEEIPYKKIDFYEQVYAALFNDHDKTKGGAYVHEKKTKLDKYQFEQILRAFGFLCLKADKVEYSDQLIHQLLGQAIGRFSWLKIRVDDFLYDITHAVPFILKDGNEYRWIHKSFMEYFVACFICYDNRESEEKYIKKMTTSENSMKYYNILDFCYEMDTLGFRKYAILPFVENYSIEYEKYFRNEYFNDFDKESLEIAKHLLALKLNVYVINNTYTDEAIMYNNEKYYKPMMNQIKKDTQHEKLKIGYFSCDDFIYAVGEVSSVVYKLMLEKIPDIFEIIHLQSQDTPLEKNRGTIKFTDDISNPINENKNTFNIIVRNFFMMMFSSDDMILNYNKCNELMRDIKSESSYMNNDIFNL